MTAGCLLIAWLLSSAVRHNFEPFVKLPRGLSDELKNLLVFSSAVWCNNYPQSLVFYPQNFNRLDLFRNVEGVLWQTLKDSNKLTRDGCQEGGYICCFKGAIKFCQYNYPMLVKIVIITSFCWFWLISHAGNAEFAVNLEYFVVRK